MTLTHFIVETPAPGYTGFAFGSQVNADVIFRELFDRGGIALATGETPPVGIVPSETRAKIVNGVLQDASGTPGVQLKCDQAALNLTAPLQYHVAFHNIDVDGKPASIADFTFAADSTPGYHRNLFTVTPTASLLAMALPQIPVSGITDATAFIKGLLTGATDAATARTTLGISGSGAEWESFVNLAAFPVTGNAALEYVAQDTGKIYRWNGSAYIQIADKASVGLGAVDNTSDATKNSAAVALTNKDLTSGTNTFPTFNQNTTGSAAKWTTPRNLDGQAVDGTADVPIIAPGTHAATNKATPVDADELPLADSAATFGLKKLTWANLKAAVKAYYDSVTSVLTNKDLTSGTNTFPTLNQNTTGSAAKLTTARNINGVAFDGTANITVADSTKLATSAVVDNTDGTIAVGSVNGSEPLGNPVIVTTSAAPAIGLPTYYNATSGNLTPALPALSGLRVGARLAVRRDPADASTNTVTISCAGADTFYSSGSTSFTLPLFGEQREFQVVSVSSVKYWVPAGSLNPLSGLDGRYLFTSFMPAPSGDTTGVKDTAALAIAQAAIPNGIGSIVWRSGTYWMTGNVGNIPSFQHWYGQGQGATILKMAAGQNGDFIVTKNWSALKGTTATSIATGAVCTLTAGSATITAPATTFAAVQVGDLISTSPTIVQGTIVTAVTTVGSGTDSLIISIPAVFSETSYVVNYCHVPCGWGLHHMTLDGNGYYGTGNQANRLTRPAAPTVTATGTTGSTTYAYMVSALNAIGETIASPETVITNGNATLTGANYNALSWTAVTGATSYNIYRNSTSGLEVFLVNVGTNSYNDTGAATLTFGRFFPCTDTSGGRVLGTYGFGWEIEGVEIRNGASCGWDSQCSSTASLNANTFHAVYNTYIRGVTCLGNYGGNRFYGPTDIQIEQTNFVANGSGGTALTNGSANLDIGTSGVSFTNFHFYGGFCQWGVRVAGSTNSFSDGAMEDGAQYLASVLGSLNNFAPISMYATASNGSSVIGVYNNGLFNKFDANMSNVTGGTLCLGPGAKVCDYRLTHDYYTSLPPASALTGSPVDPNSRITLTVGDFFSTQTVTDIRGQIDKNTKTSITTARSGVPLTGEYLVPAGVGSGGGSALTTGLNVVSYVPLDVAAFNGQNFAGLACHITTASPSFAGGTSVQILMSLYPDDGTGTRPSGSRITAYDCTITTANLATGIIKVNFGTTPQLLPQGRYWAAFLYTYATVPTTPPSVMVNKPLCSNVLTAGASSFQSSFYGWQQSVTGTPAALPAAIGSLANQFAWAGAGAPVVALVAQ